MSFDSNAWEKNFDPADHGCAPIRAALTGRKLEGFICEAGFRIEAVEKRDRAAYFAVPLAEFRVDGIVEREGQPYLKMSFGPADDLHPGLPAKQSVKLQSVLASGIRLMRGVSWLGLPAPQELRNPAVFVVETPETARERERRQIDVFCRINARGVGKATFDAVGGWNLPAGSPTDKKKFRKACAEWADGELVGAHIAYQNDILCTNDRARAAGTSIFNEANRSWLGADYGVTFQSIDELLVEITK